MPSNRSPSAMISITFGVALLIGAPSALARGGGAHAMAGGAAHGVTGQAMLPGQSGSTATTMPGATAGSPSRLPPASGSSRSGSPSSSSGAGISTEPLPFTPLTPSTGPSDGLPPRQELPQTIAPALPQLPDQFATGGSSGVDLSASAGSSSPSESAPSTPGGGGKSLADCMGFWDAATHMSKVEWRAACKRSMQEFPDVKW